LAKGEGASSGGPSDSAPFRWRAVDATRGVAMALVCASHFSSTYPRGSAGAPVLFLLLHRIGMVATPTFVVVSGLVLGLRAVAFPDDVPRLRRRTLDRGLFLLLGARPVILAAHLVKAGGLGAALRWCFVTDALGICALAGPWLLGLPRMLRVGAAIAACGCAWFAASFLGTRDGSGVSEGTARRSLSTSGHSVTCSRLFPGWASTRCLRP